MPSIVDESGLQVDVEGEIVLTDEVISRLRDMIIVRLRDRSNLSFRDIGKIMNLSRNRVNERYNSVPAGTRKHYESVQLG